MACGDGSGDEYALNDISIYVAADDATLQDRMRSGTVAAYMPGCSRTTDGELGTLYLTRDKSDVAIVAVMAGLVHQTASGVSHQSAQSCRSGSQDDCLLSTRRFRYSTHETGVVPVLLEASCVNLRPACGPGETCRAGVCSADKSDPGEGSKKDAGASDGGTKDTGAKDAGAPPLTPFVCAGKVVAWTPEPPADPSCKDGTKTRRCLVNRAGKYVAVCEAPSANPCVEPCCAEATSSTQICCISQGLPVLRDVGFVPGCPSGEPRPCFSAPTCRDRTCAGDFDPSAGFGTCTR
jgi:hypothetical protein